MREYSKCSGPRAQGSRIWGRLEVQGNEDKSGKTSRGQFVMAKDCRSYSADSAESEKHFKQGNGMKELRLTMINQAKCPALFGRQKLPKKKGEAIALI